jgi:hypothetical protein
LGEDGAGGVVHRGEQVDLPAVASGAAERLAVDRDRTPPLASVVTVGQPRTDRGSQRLGVQTGQGPADRGLGRHRPTAGEWIAVGAERCADRLVSVDGPLGDRGERPCAGQHRCGSDGEDGNQWMATPGAGSRVVDGGEIGEQVWWFGCSERVSVGQDGQAWWDRG